MRQNIDYIVCVDKNYITYLINLLGNVQYFSRTTDSTFHILCNSESKSVIQEELKKSGKFNCKIYEINEMDLAEFPVSGHVTVATYYRLLIGELLPVEITRAIYLDLDILVQDDLYKLWKLNIPETKVIAAVKNDDFESNINRLALKENMYFNAGVMLIDLEKWRSLDVYNKSLDVVKKNQISVVWWDQDILNYLFDGKVMELHKSWNYQLLIFRGQNWLKYLLDRPSIIHFTGGGTKNKPWFNSCENVYGYKYRYYSSKFANSNRSRNLSKKRKLKALFLKIMFKSGLI